MFPRLLKAGLAFTLLLGCYLVYARAFDLVVERLKSARATGVRGFRTHMPKSRKEALALARKAFGPDHWIVNTDTLFAYYNSERGFWMFASNVDYAQEENGVKYDGKRLVLKPFAAIWRSSDGRNLQTLTGESATLDLNQSLGFGGKSKSEEMKVQHALVAGHVEIRDDRGTSDKPRDDMIITMDWAEFDEATQMIKTDSHVEMHDPDQTTQGDALRIGLWKPEPGKPASAGFGGAEYIKLLKNVHVSFRDMGGSGAFPGAGGANKGRPAGAKPAATSDGAGSPTEGAARVPSPGDIRSDGPMTAKLARPRAPVAEGPPSPPAPTIVTFERNVIGQQGRPGERPNQLNCDTLVLTLNPGEKPPAPKPGGGGGGGSAEGDVAKGGAAEADMAKAGAVKAGAAVEGGAASSSPFGNLVLHKAHATGHVVWLQLLEQGVKVRCNELIYERLAPDRPDKTYFRGDATRPIWLEKIDREVVVAQAGANGGGAAPSRTGKILGVTRVETLDATLFDQGGGLDLADVVARGPGTLESRADFQSPIERRAEWQDELKIHNIVGAGSQLAQKQITLTGSRPSFEDAVRKTAMDSNERIIAWLKPQPKGQGRGADQPAGSASAASSSGSGLGGGLAGNGLQIERLQAVGDAHFRAPGRVMSARRVLDATFVEAAPAQPAPSQALASATPAPSGPGAVAANETAPDTGPDAKPAGASSEKDGPAAPDSLMTGAADWIWAKVALAPGSGLQGSSRRASSTGTGASTSTASGQGGKSPPREADEGGADVREAWLRGNVALHQESSPAPPKGGGPSSEKTKTEDITGEAVYLDNQHGNGKIRAWVYQRDPNEPPRPGPLPWARVVTEDMAFRGELLRVDQEHDKIWADGPGTLAQWTDRALFTDKAAADDKAGTAEDAAAPRSDAATTRSAMRPADDWAGGPQDATNAESEALAREKPAPKPRTRAGKPVPERDLLTIAWNGRMEFTGRTRDATGQPAGRADFFGAPNAMMEDAQLKCDDHMIVFTDREVPLGELGSLTRQSGADDGKDASAPSRQIDVSMIHCFGNALGVFRKIDPDRPIVLEKQIILADDRLDYNHRTGEFLVKGPGRIYKYDRSGPAPSKTGADASGPDAENDERADTAENGGQARRGRGRTIVPTGRRASENDAGSDRSGQGPDSKSKSQSQSKTREIGPLVLTQVFFSTGMQGRFGTGQANDTNRERTALLFGDVETQRAGVRSVHEAFRFDRPLPVDGFFMTSQILRLIQEPPPPGSPAATPSRTFLKAWDNVVVNKGQADFIQADIGTYDSSSDVLYAYGEGNRGVVIMQQAGAGQPASPMHARAVQFNVKTRQFHGVDSDMVQFFDHRTGARPSNVPAADPNRKKPKRSRGGFMVPNNNLERRGFTGY